MLVFCNSYQKNIRKNEKVTNRTISFSKGNKFDSIMPKKNINKCDKQKKSFLLTIPFYFIEEICSFTFINLSIKTYA